MNVNLNLIWVWKVCLQDKRFRAWWSPGFSSGGVLQVQVGEVWVWEVSWWEPGPSPGCESGAGCCKNSDNFAQQHSTGEHWTQPPWRNGDISSQHHTFTQEPLTTLLRNNFQPHSYTQEPLTTSHFYTITTYNLTLWQRKASVLHRNHL